MRGSRFAWLAAYSRAAHDWGDDSFCLRLHAKKSNVKPESNTGCTPKLPPGEHRNYRTPFRLNRSKQADPFRRIDRPTGGPGAHDFPCRLFFWGRCRALPRAPEMERASLPEQFEICMLVTRRTICTSPYFEQKKVHRIASAGQHDITCDLQPPRTARHNHNRKIQHQAPFSLGGISGSPLGSACV